MRMAKKKDIRKRGGFLIELLIVIGIMAVIGGAAFILVNPQIAKARDAKIKEDLIQIRNALAQYHYDTNCFPQSLPACGQDFTKNNTIYFKNFPCSPTGIPYAYQTENKTCNSWYKVLANLENPTDKSIDMIGCRTGCGVKCDYNYGLSSTNIGIDDGCIKQYACSTSGTCIIFADPAASRCPNTYINDPTCQNQCVKKSNQCHDERGKQN